MEFVMPLFHYNCNVMQINRQYICMLPCDSQFPSGMVRFIIFFSLIADSLFISRHFVITHQAILPFSFKLNCLKRYDSSILDEPFSETIGYI